MKKSGSGNGSDGVNHSAAMDEAKRPKRTHSKSFVRYILPSDAHHFIGRIFDLSIVSLGFDGYADLAKHSDCKYAIDTNYDLSGLTRRVESLNLVGELLWPEPIPENFKDFPISRYDWLTVTADVFLMRYVSVVDCALLLVNAVYEVGLSPQECTFKALKNKVSPNVRLILKGMLDDQGALRLERNARIHHGAERGFTQDDQTFKMATLSEHRGSGMTGTDRFGRQINVKRSFREALVELQREFNRTTRRLVRQLDKFYNELSDEFESRFGPRIMNATHGLNAGSKRLRER